MPIERHALLSPVRTKSHGTATGFTCMKGKKRMRTMRKNEEGKVRGWILLWALGIPVPILLLLFLLRGCT
jgi:hypothetical protein